jgi:hypothetical protein
MRLAVSLEQVRRNPVQATRGVGGAGLTERNGDGQEVST